MQRLDFAYARARLQARHSGLPDARLWRQLEASHTAAHYLTLARTGPLGPWLAGLSEATEVPRIEAHLRARWQAYVAEVASWQPARWQAATRWFGTLPGLPLIEQPLRADRAAGWLQAWQRLAGDAPAVAALMPDVAVKLMPRLPGAMVARQAKGGPIGAVAGRSARAETERQALLKLFRRHAASPVGAWAHLALVALNLERLRGGLVARLLLGPPQGAGASTVPGAQAA